MSEAASQIVDQMQAPAVEVPLDQTNEVPSSGLPNKDEKVSSRVEILIKREQAARQREAAANAKEREVEEKIAKREAEFDLKWKRIQEFDQVKEDPKKALEILGVDYNQITQSVLSDGSIPPELQIKKIEAKFEAFQKAQEDGERSKAEAQKLNAQAQEEKAISNFKLEITSELKKNLERYELIAFEDEEDLVFQVIDEHYRRTIDPETGIGKVMAITEAADRVEEHLEKKYDKSRSLNKVKTLWSAIPKELQSQIAKPETKPSQPPKTLSNKLSATPQPARKSPVTDEERVQRAIAYAKSLRT